MNCSCKLGKQNNAGSRMHCLVTSVTNKRVWRGFESRSYPGACFYRFFSFFSTVLLLDLLHFPGSNCTSSKQYHSSMKCLNMAHCKYSYRIVYFDDLIQVAPIGDQIVTFMNRTASVGFPRKRRGFANDAPSKHR